MFFDIATDIKTTVLADKPTTIYFVKKPKVLFIVFVVIYSKILRIG